MHSILSYDFIQNAIVASILISIATGIIGSLIVSNKMVFIAGGIAHSSYSGIGLAFFFGFSPFLGAMMSAVFAACIIAYLSYKNKKHLDTIIGAIWGIGMAIGIIFVDLTPEYSGDLMSYLFGSILSVPSEEIWIMGFIDIVIIVSITLFYKEFLAVSFDSEFARLRGINTALFYFLIILFSSIVVVITMRGVGLILIMALLTIPVFIASKISNSLASMIFTSSTLATIFSLIGLYISYQFDISSGASIILVASTGFIIELFVSKLLK